MKFIVYQNERAIKWILFASIIGSLILAIRVVIAYGGVGAMIEYASKAGEHRVGELTNENTIGLFMASAALSCICLLFFSKGIVKKILLSVLMVVFIAMLLLTGSKKAMVFIVVGCLIFLFFITRKQRFGTKVFIATIILLLVFVIIYAVSNIAAFGTIKTRLEQLLNVIFLGEEATHTDGTRFNMMEDGLQAFLQSPIFGNGTAYSYELFDTYSHNNFVEILMNYGIVGFTIYYLPYIFLVPKLWKLAKNKDIYAMYFLVYIALQILLSIGWVNYYERIPQLLTAAAWGYVSAKSIRGEKDEATPYYHIVKSESSNPQKSYCSDLKCPLSPVKNLSSILRWWNSWYQ